MWPRILLFALVVLAACGVAFVPPPVSPQLVAAGRARWADATPETLQRGHDTFVASCGKGGFCHKLRNPHAYPAEKWPRILVKMAKKAHLDPAQEQDVLRFVLAVRDLPETPASAPAPAAAPASPAR